MCMAVVSNGSHSGVGVEVSKDYPGAFNCGGAWYVWERDLTFTQMEAIKKLYKRGGLNGNENLF